MEDLGIVPQVLRRSSAEYEYSGVVFDFDVIEGEIGFHPITAPLDIGIPAGLEIVHHQIQPPARGSRDKGFPSLLLKPVYGVKRFVRIRRRHP